MPHPAEGRKRHRSPPRRAAFGTYSVFALTRPLRSERAWYEISAKSRFSKRDQVRLLRVNRLECKLAINVRPRSENICLFRPLRFESTNAALKELPIVLEITDFRKDHYLDA
jgi:hypothetical protein